MTEIGRLRLAPPSSFVGRRAALATLRDLVARARLVTLVGAGGIGKTRLAVAFAGEQRADYDEIVACDLCEAKRASDLVEAVGTALGAASEAHVAQALAARGRCLLVLDNLEQILGAASTIMRWLEAAPLLRVLATSRERLSLPGEVVYEIEPLSIEDEALALWTDRVRAVHPGYGISAEDAPIVAEIVRELDGIPLAIELAAARTRMLDVRTLRRRLSERLDLLARGPRTVVARHETFRATLDWSWNLLTPVERDVLAQCSVFCGGFSVEAAEAVVDLGAYPCAPPVLDVVASLRDKSLLRLGEIAPGVARLRLYSVVRDFAAERLRSLGGTNAARARHARYFAALGDGLAERARERGPAAVVDEVLADRDNLACVADRAIAGELDDPQASTLAWRTVLALDAVYPQEKNVGAIRMIEALFTLPLPTHPALRARARIARAGARVERGKLTEAHADVVHAEHDARLAGSAALIAWALAKTAVVHTQRGLVDEAVSTAERAVATAREAGDALAEGYALMTLAVALKEAGHVERALGANAVALAVHRERGDAYHEAWTLTGIGFVYLELGDTDRAREHLMRAREMGIAHDSKRLAASKLAGIAALEHEAGDLAEARALYDRAIEHFRSSGDVRHEAITRGFVGIMQLEQGLSVDAEAALAGAMRALHDVGDERCEGLFGTYCAFLASERGAIDRATEQFDASDRLLERAGDEGFVRCARLLRARLDVALLARASSLGDRAAVAEHLARARARIADARAAAVTVRSYDLRLALRVVERALARAEVQALFARSEAEIAAGSLVPVVVHRGGDWLISSAGVRTDFCRRPALRSVLRMLVEARLARPGVPVPREQMVRAAWPESIPSAAAAKNRIHVLVSTLRDAGLRRALARRGDGYVLAEDVPLRMADEG